MRPKLDLKRIAKTLRAHRRGKVESKAGYFGALALAAEVASRFRVPPNGGRATDPEWTERRLVALAPTTLARLERLAARLRKAGVAIEPLQLAALLLERATAATDDDAADLLGWTP